VATPLIDDDELDDLEREFVARVRGRVLEIGVGDGENFGAFDPDVEWQGLEPDATRRAELATRAKEWRHAAVPLDAKAESIPLPDHSVDGATCGFALRNLVELPKFFDELGRVVRPGGRIALLDVGVPRNKLIRSGNNLYFGKVVPKIGGLLSDGAAYRYLPRSVAYLPSPQRMLSDLRDAGFTEVQHLQLSGGLTQLLLGTRS